MLRYFIILCCTNIAEETPQSAVTLTDQIDKLRLAPHLDVLEDPKRLLTIQKVASPLYASRFTPNKQAIPNFGRTHSAYWIRFTLNNQSDLKWYMRINALLGRDLTLYIINDDGQQRRLPGRPPFLLLGVLVLVSVIHAIIS